VGAEVGGVGVAREEQVQVGCRADDADAASAAAVGALEHHGVTGGGDEGLDPVAGGHGRAERAGKVLAVEIDRGLIPILAESLAEYDNVEVIQGDILEQNLNDLSERLGGKRIKVVANLPYYITTPILMKLLESGLPIENITVMVQKEVAERMQASPGGKDYGSLSLAVQYYAAAEIVANVPPHCFLPRPKVGSAVICLRTYAEKPVQTGDEAFLFRIIRASFNQRRKTLVNGLKNAGFSREKVNEALSSLGLPETVRGEVLSLAQFAALAELLRA